jgi:hypothetical protein
MRQTTHIAAGFDPSQAGPDGFVQQLQGIPIEHLRGQRNPLTPDGFVLAGHVMDSIHKARGDNDIGSGACKINCTSASDPEGATDNHRAFLDQDQYS